jgi:hypothetical protein
MPNRFAETSGWAGAFISSDRPGPCELDLWIAAVNKRRQVREEIEEIAIDDERLNRSGVLGVAWRGPAYCFSLLPAPVPQLQKRLFIVRGTARLTRSHRQLRTVGRATARAQFSSRRFRHIARKSSY